MTAELHLERGDGPGVVLLHGVGAGPSTFVGVADRLATDHRVLVVERPGGGLSLGAQADEVASLLADLGATGVTVVGVSGGATLALALAIDHPGVAAALVVHEPLVGRHAPVLHRRFAVAEAQASAGPDETLAVVQAVMGDFTWGALDGPTRAEVVAGADRWRAEIPRFAAFDPSQDELRSLGAVPVLSTVGERSGPERHDAARVLARLSGARVEVIPGAGNAVQLDAPAAFARVIGTWLGVPAP